MGARVTFKGGKPLVTDGPFAETKEVLGGYWMIDVASREEAIDWASRCPAGPNEIIEIRQVQEIADFPAEVQHTLDGFERCCLGAAGLSRRRPASSFRGARPQAERTRISRASGRNAHLCKIGFARLRSRAGMAAASSAHRYLR